MTDKSEFFTPIEFPSEQSAADQEPKAPQVVWDENHLSDAKKAIAKETSKIRAGVSKLTVRAIDNGKFKMPADQALITFLEDPSDELLQRVKELTVQDYGQRVSDHFVGLLKNSRKEVPNE